MNLVEYLSVASAGTGQKTFYNTRKEQETALTRIHSGMLVTDRRIYALSAAFPFTDKSRQLIVANLLSSAARATDLELEDHVIAFVLKNIQFNRVLNVLCELVDAKVNNSRTRRIMRFLWNQHIDAFRAIKYRDKVRRILRHAHVPEPEDGEKRELHRWIFGKITKPSQATEGTKLRARLRARTDYSAVFELPFDIARDIAVTEHKKSPEEFARDFAGTETKAGKGRATRKETMRAKSVAKDVEVDYLRFHPIELLNRAYRTPDEWPQIRPALQAKAAELAEYLELPEKVAVVVDNSRSAMGSGQRLYHPLAVIESITRVCLELPTSVSLYFVGPCPDASSGRPGRNQSIDSPFRAEGASDLRMPLARALMSRPDLVLILSDGYENMRAGSAAQILQTRAVRESGIAIIHLNPVAAAEAGDVRRLSDKIPTYGLSSPEQLPLRMLLAQAEMDPTLLAPLFDRIEEAFKIGDHKAVKSAVRVRSLEAV